VIEMDIHIITAMTKNRVIGKDNSLPWKISEDSKLFKELTTGKTIIMGKNTWYSLPERLRPLPGRINIVVGHISQTGGNVATFFSIDEALAYAEKLGNDVYFIGGEKIYDAALSKADYLHISWIKKDYDGNKYFPEIDFSEWVEIENKEYNEFTYKVYKRIY
jgi:dihydrofolate reductase